MVADANPDGSSRGLVQVPGAAGPGAGHVMHVTERGLLQVARTLHNGAIHQGVVPVPPVSGAGAMSALMRYMQDSEQVVGHRRRLRHG